MAEIFESVRSKYGSVAESKLSSNDAGVKAVAEAFGYSAEELTSIPQKLTWDYRVAILRQPLTCTSVRLW